MNGILTMERFQVSNAEWFQLIGGPYQRRGIDYWTYGHAHYNVYVQYRGESARLKSVGYVSP